MIKTFIHSFMPSSKISPLKPFRNFEILLLFFFVADYLEYYPKLNVTCLKYLFFPRQLQLIYLSPIFTSST